MATQLRSEILSEKEQVLQVVSDRNIELSDKIEKVSEVLKNQVFGHKEEMGILDSNLTLSEIWINAKSASLYAAHVNSDALSLRSSKRKHYDGISSCRVPI